MTAAQESETLPLELDVRLAHSVIWRSTSPWNETTTTSGRYPWPIEPLRHSDASESNTRCHSTLQVINAALQDPGTGSEEIRPILYNAVNGVLPTRSGDCREKESE